VIGDAKELLAGLAVFEIPVARGGLVDGMTLTLTISPIGSRSHKIAASAGGGTSAPGLPGVEAVGLRPAHAFDLYTGLECLAVSGLSSSNPVLITHLADLSVREVDLQQVFRRSDNAD
jgi:hypothetical protein